MKKSLASLLVLLALTSCTGVLKSPAKEMDKMSRWSEARYGMFVHWGLSSLIGTEISWSRNAYGPEKYDSLALRFNPVDFDPDKWIDAAESAGMKYIILTTKHHDGFCLWDSEANPHNIMNSPYHKDVCKMLADAAHRRGMGLGWYFSCREWSDADCCTEGQTAAYAEKMKGELTELLTRYGDIDILWFDYDGWPSPVQPREIVDLIRGLQPDIVFNNRLYPLTPDESHACVGDFGMYCTPEQFVGGYGEVPWESCSTMGESWQWAIRYGDKPRPVEDLVWETVGAAGGNGNMLMNVGPDSLGVIPPIFTDRLAEIGTWLKSHDGILYGTTCGPWKPTSRYVSTMKDGGVWLLLHDGSDILLPISDKYAVKSVTADDGIAVPFVTDSVSLSIDVPAGLKGKRNVALRIVFSGDVPSAGEFNAFTTSGSLAYNRPCSATSSLSEVYMHCPASAFDDSERTAWVVGRRSDDYPMSLYGHVGNYTDSKQIADAFEKNATLEVEIPAEKAVSYFKIIARNVWGGASLEYFSNGEWTQVAEAAPLDGNWSGDFASVNAQKWRIVLKDGKPGSGISEFQLF